MNVSKLPNNLFCFPEKTRYLSSPKFVRQKKYVSALAGTADYHSAVDLDPRTNAYETWAVVQPLFYLHLTCLGLIGISNDDLTPDSDAVCSTS